MLGGLTKRLTDIVSGLRGRKITEEVVKETSREIRRALLEADASLPVVKDFEKRVREAALGAEVIEGVDAGQMFTKIVQDELTELMGPVDHEIAWKSNSAWRQHEKSLKISTGPVSEYAFSIPDRFLVPAEFHDYGVGKFMFIQQRFFEPGTRCF